MNINPALVIDGILLIVLAADAVRGYKDGFFTAVIRLFGTVGSLLAGFWAADNYSRQIFEKYLRRPFTERSYNYLSQLSRNIDIQTALSDVFIKLPPRIVSSVTEKAETALSRILAPDMESAVYLVEEFIRPIATAAISVVVFILTFAAVKLICNFFAWLLKAVNNVPILGAANKMAGFAAGLATGAINIILLSFIMSIIVVVTGNSLPFLNTEIINRSHILALTGAVNPLLP